MSHNTDPERAARRHPAPLIGIALALLVAVAAFVWWMGAPPEEAGDVSRIEATEAPQGGALPPPADPPAADTPAAGSPPAPSN